MTTNGTVLRSVLIGSYLVLFGALVGYFIWLGTAVIDIRERVKGLEITTAALSTARDRTIDQRIDTNTRRIENLGNAQ